MDTNLRVILLMVLSLAASFVIAAVPLLSPVWVLLTIWLSHRLLLTPGKAKRDGSDREGNFWGSATSGIIIGSMLMLVVWLVLALSVTSTQVGAVFTSVQYEFPPEFTSQPMPEFTREPMTEATRAVFERTLTAQPPMP